MQHDDGVDATARKAVMQVTKGRETPNGCPLTATMFTQLDSEGWTSKFSCLFRPSLLLFFCLCCMYPDSDSMAWGACNH